MRGMGTSRNFSDFDIDRFLVHSAFANTCKSYCNCRGMTNGYAVLGALLIDVAAILDSFFRSRMQWIGDKWALHPLSGARSC